MTVVADISVSLDGFVTGPDPGPALGLGHGGDALHTWVFDGDDVDAAVLRDATESTGAVIMGRRLFDIIDGPDGWTDDMGYGAGHATSPPFFVVTHAAPGHVRLDLSFAFVTDGLAAAVEQAVAAARARCAAGDAAREDVVVMGGGEVIRRCIDEGLVDELRLHLAPVVLGGGTPLFAGAAPRQLVQRSVRVSSTATHLTFAVTR